MGKTSASKGSKRSKVDRASQKRLAKSQVAATNAKRNLAIITKQLSEAVRALIHSRAGTSKETQSAKNVRAATKGFVAARKKLRKAEKKRRKAAARLLKAAARAAVAASKPSGSRMRAARKATSPAPKKRPRKPKRPVVAAPSLTGSESNTESGSLLAPDTGHQSFRHPED